jgi:hypothetical protein
MNRSTTLLLIAVALGGYGVYIASYVPAMLVGTLMPVLLSSRPCVHSRPHSACGAAGGGQLARGCFLGSALPARGSLKDLSLASSPICAPRWSR